MNKVKSKLLGLIIACFSIFALTTSTHSNFVMHDGNNKIQAQTFSSDNYKNKLQEFSYQNQQSWNNDTSLHTLKGKKVYQGKTLKTKNGELNIEIDGWKKIVYRGGWFRQDKVEWTGRSRIWFERNRYWWQNYTYNTVDQIELAVNSWIGGYASPSFEFNGKTKYSGIFTEGTTRLTSMSVGIDAYSKELIHALGKKEEHELYINYNAAGWNYQITGFGQYASGLALDENEFSSIKSNDSFLPDLDYDKSWYNGKNGSTAWRRNANKVPIELFNSEQEVYLDDKNSKFIKKI
ncbi:hypothetical protein R7X75_00775 [Mesomycoplasma ovipneumoniae]|uniref:hypothetical protein n=1 Tax=Mesomycoplasma ovipneumoniae TaxID=29562 RepID=UPI002964E9F1|nr:hypothetical protein [Mesomycoplasma ovipneumoniae]MDW2928965.1 hypothetical protein [Mesomycoplasma ovipneumoniae]